ncbi:hypothetical protein [Streptomyces ipomoeae]|uniref:hypothetical protein n=1 Tax=Streptomyces ipomoeae TaxID=103232 RepID=UPI001147326E|nr:hypothetical protein [Streptomyces ipomoeae]TQE33119.1 hypothetical protein Sipo7851_21725 [Streptomyces ipomoeae]
MREWLLALAYPLLMCASFLFAAGHTLRRRWHRRRGHLEPDAYPNSSPRHQAVDALEEHGQHAVQTAERIVATELERVDDPHNPSTDNPTH